MTNLETKYGKIDIEKEIPDAVWGYTQRRNKLTGKTVQVHDFSQLFVLRFSNPVPIDSVKKNFSSLPEVEFVHQPVSISYDDEPNDPSYQSGIQWNLDAVDASDAWNVTHGSSAIKIGVVDEGIKENHEDLSGKIVGGTGYFIDTLKHGTWVAGVLGANTNNNKGISSLGWDLKLYNYGGPNFASSHGLVAQRIVNATNAGMDIINMSFGTLKVITLEEYFDYAPNCTGQSRQKWIDRIELGQIAITNDYAEIRDAVADAISTGIICVASAGNASPNNNLLLPSPELCDPVQIPFHNYPSEYPGVIAVSGTWLYYGNEEFYPAWNYGNFINVSAPGKDIYTTDPNGSYSYRSGTSFAAPLTAALAGLIKSINPSFSYQQVTSILENTADKITAPTGHLYNSNGYSDALGYGRINAHNALLEALYETALTNKSTLSSASGPNNQRILERGHHGGYLYEVFASGNEIFYRRSSNNGSSWSITKRLSSGNGNNSSVSIAAGDDGSVDNLRAVWERKIDNTHYEIWYSYSLNGGSSWSTPAIINGCSNVTISYYQSNADYAGGPTPVVASYWRGGAEGNASFLMVYAASNGLHFRYADESNNSWTIPGNDIVAGATSQYSWYPSLATYNSEDYKVYLIYGQRFSNPHVYFQHFNQDVTWSSRVQADNANNYNRYASIAVDNTGAPIASWCGQNPSYSGQNSNGRYTITYKQGNTSGGWIYGKEWVEGTDAFSPALTYYNRGGTYPYGVDVLYHTTSNKYVFSQVYSGSPTSDWTKHTLASGNGYAPNISHETSSSVVPKQIWTNQSSSPYSLVYNSNYLPKENLAAQKEFHRAVEVTDSLTDSHLRIEITQPVITTTSGKEIYIPFANNSEPYSELIKTNPFDFLKTDADNLPSDAETISFKVYINSSKPDTLEGGKISTDKTTPFKNINFESELKNNLDKSLLSSFGKILLSDVKGNYRYSKSFVLDINGSKNKDVIISPEVSFLGTFKKSNLRYGLVDVTVMNDSSLNKNENKFASTETRPTEYILDQNYPNPFNPSTEIDYSLKASGHVTLQIFDMLGREVKTLINEDESEGNHKVNFDASSLSSGIYFYSLTSTPIGGQAESFHQTRKMILLR